MSEVDDLIGQKPERLWYVLRYNPEQPKWTEMHQGLTGIRDYRPGTPDPATVELRAFVDSDLPKGSVTLYRLVPVD